MQPVIYDVAVSADGFICDAQSDVSRFPHQGSMVDDYVARLGTYSHCLMGRKTYEFGYGFGLKPGENPYPMMKSVVFSKTLNLPGDADVQTVAGEGLGFVKALRETSVGPIYLCGGGALAGWLVSQNAIQVLRLKRAPILLGGGIRLFGAYRGAVAMKMRATKPHEDGAFFQEFDLTVG